MTDDSPSLTVRTATGASWVIIWRLSTRALGVVSTVVLVRLLAPADFGLVALATSFSQALDWLSALGVRDALVRERSLNRALYDTAFTLNALRGVVMGAIVAACAWPVGAFFGDPRLVGIMLVLGAVTVLFAGENIGTVDFRRDLAFDKDFQLAVVPRIASILASITVAVVFRSYWALVTGIVTNAVLRLILSYWMHPYRPWFTLRAYAQIIGFSFWTWACAIVVMIRDRIDTVVIGRMFGPTLVGIYAVGLEIGALTSTEVVEPLTAALFPGFAEARRSGVDPAEGYFKSLSATFLVTLPMGVGVSLLARPAVLLAFGPRWVEAVPLVQVFALVCMAKVVAYISAVLLNAHGLIVTQFRILLSGLIVKAVVLAALIGSFGMMGAVAATSASIAVEESLFLVKTFHHLGLHVRDLIRATWRCAVATLAMTGVLVALGLGWATAADTSLGMARDLALGTLCGAVTYALVLLLAWWASGKPDGAERTFLDVFSATFRHVVTRRRPSRTLG